MPLSPCKVGAVSDTPRPDQDIENAMKAAVASVEAREKGDAPAATEAAAAAPEGSVDTLRVELLAARRALEEATEKAKKDATELRDRWIRTAADLENYKKRAAKEQENVAKFGAESVLKDLLPVLDDLDRTLQAAEAGAKSSESAQLGSFVDGLRLVQKKFLAQLEKAGASTFPVVGIGFDPNLHEAVQQVASPTVPAGAVVAELRRGFMLNGRLLRPALVVVSVGPEAEA